MLTSIFKKEAISDNYAYPNPANNVLHLSHSLNASAISILNLQGEIVIELSEPTESIDISSLDSGSYYLQIIANGEMHVENVVVY